VYSGIRWLRVCWPALLPGSSGHSSSVLSHTARARLLRKVARLSKKCFQKNNLQFRRDVPFQAASLHSFLLTPEMVLKFDIVFFL